MRRYLTADDVVRRTGIPATILARWRSETYRTGQQVGPVFCKFDERKKARVFYPTDLLQRWMEWHERQSPKRFSPPPGRVAPCDNGAGGSEQRQDA